MQRRHFLIIALLPFFISASLDKQEPPATDAFPMEGNYVDTGKYPADTLHNLYSFSIEIGGVLKVQDFDSRESGQGQWKTEGCNTITGTYQLLKTRQTCSFRAKINTTTGRLEGTWGINKNIDGGGYWSMKRTN